MPKSVAKSPGNWFARPQWTTRHPRTGKNSRLSSARTTKCPVPKRWSTPSSVTTWLLANGCSNTSTSAHPLWIRTATVSTSATSIRRVSMSTTTGMTTTTTTWASRPLGTSIFHLNLKRSPFRRAFRLAVFG